MFREKMYRSVFESEWKWLCSKVMLPGVFESDPVTSGGSSYQNDIQYLRGHTPMAVAKQTIS